MNETHNTSSGWIQLDHDAVLVECFADGSVGVYRSYMSDPIAWGEMDDGHLVLGESGSLTSVEVALIDYEVSHRKTTADATKTIKTRTLSDNEIAAEWHARLERSVR